MQGIEEAIHTNLAEADRLMTVCNSCRYCEGLCAVFPAMEMRRSFSTGDLSYLANLCHGCGACYTDCQFSPPHEFNVNIPKVLAQVRTDSYRRYAWPRALQPMFDRNGLAISLVCAVSVAGFILGFALWHDPQVLFTDAGNFYRLLPHAAMASIFMAVSIFALVAFVMSFLNFWRDIGAGKVRKDSVQSLWQAVRDVATLRYLDGGGAGCYNVKESPKDHRRLFHHLTFYGFGLCFAATMSGSAYEYLLGRSAPYEWYDLPQILGSLGGVGLIIGPPGLLWAKFQRDPTLLDKPRLGMDVAFIVMLFFAGLSGMLLMLLRLTPAMGVLLAVHLGVVFALFLTMPYSKFVHGLYRFGALVVYAYERRNQPGSGSG